LHHDERKIVVTLLQSGRPKREAKPCVVNRRRFCDVVSALTKSALGRKPLRGDVNPARSQLDEHFFGNGARLVECPSFDD
jgi:hypothetical protein